MIRVDVATVLLQWAAGGLFFLWFTTRLRVVSVGYGWLLRGTYLVMAVGAAAAGFKFGLVPVREASSIAVAVAAGAAAVVSVIRRKAGVSGQSDEHDRRSERVAAMTGIERGITQRDGGAEFPPWLDLVAPAASIAGLVAASVDAGGNLAVSLLRMFAGAAFLGCVTDAMLLGHWYLTQPGLPRRYLNELVRALGWVWPVEVVALLLPTGMFSVWSGSVSDGWGGQLGWFWAACALTTLVLVLVTKAALRERYYSAVMAATGLLYLAILTAFGTDLIARAILAG
ncbi:MAG TPA: hypothetical protein PK020_21730 [Ilumatobacteraceae bacterium]|nr:hypothetical protein [Ilumatobacteraceae bacterium]HRB05088.1 hypothetical protein [Ilumatobacteraceae bacterium]